MRLDTIENCTKSAQALGSIIKELEPYFKKQYNSEKNPEDWQILRTKITYGDCINVAKKSMKKVKNKEFKSYIQDWIDQTKDWFELETKPSWNYLFQSINSMFRQAFNQLTTMKMTGLSLKELMQMQGTNQKELDEKKKYQITANKFISSLDPYLKNMEPYKFKNVVCDFVRWEGLTHTLGISDDQIKTFCAFLEIARATFLPESPEYLIWSGFIRMFDAFYGSVTTNKQEDYRKYDCWSSLIDVYEQIPKEMIDKFYEKKED